MNFFKGKKLLITGGTGSLGQALCKKLRSCGGSVIIYSRDEGKQALTYGQQEDVVKIIGDIRDYDKIRFSICQHQPDYVIHAGALKRIDDLERYPAECIKTNVTGTQNVARACLEGGVEKCILISTDKACEPVNVYGASKFIGERLFTNCDYDSNSTVFSSVRYGNVIGSRGSFIPLWMNSIKNGRPITVTSMECTRFLFTLSDAVSTVLSSLVNSLGGEVFIPQINSFKMESVLQAIQKLTGSGSINSKVIGMRPGEKFHEDMLGSLELPFSYVVPEVNLIQVRPQYTKKVYQDFSPYRGEVLNSALHLEGDVGKLAALIQRGLSDAG